MKTLFLSDCHLGNPRVNTTKLLKFLYSEEVRQCHRLILVGDTFDDHYTLPYPPKTMMVLEEFLTFPEIVIIPGNHDKWISNFEGEYRIGVNTKLTVTREFIMMIGEKRFLVTHGDKYDWTMMFAVSSRKIRSTVAWLFPDIPWLRKRFTGINSTFYKKITSFTRKVACQGVICGHNHDPAHHLHDGWFEYINCGDWFTSFSGVIEEDGVFRIINV